MCCGNVHITLFICCFLLSFFKCCIEQVSYGSFRHLQTSIEPILVVDDVDGCSLMDVEVDDFPSVSKDIL